MMQLGTHVSIDGITKTLTELGLDLEDENFKDTPIRWLKFVGSFTMPFDPGKCLDAQFSNTDADDTVYQRAMIVQSNIPYQALCAHHLAPVLGYANVGYIPCAKVVGLSKLTRLVYGHCHRLPSLQEDVGNAIVDSLMEHLKPLGAMCVIKAEHGCMACRGVTQLGIETATASLRGVFIEKHESRAEFYELVKL